MYLLGIKECQYQFQWHRWNCSSLGTKSRNPHTSNLLKRGKKTFFNKKQKISYEIWVVAKYTRGNYLSSYNNVGVQNFKWMSIAMELALGI